MRIGQLQYRATGIGMLLMLLATLAVAQPIRNEWIDYSKDYYKFYVRETRIYRIGFDVLDSAGLGQVPPDHFRLISQGREIPLFISSGSQPMKAGDFLEFLGRNNSGELDKDLYEKPEHQAIDYISVISDSVGYYLTVSPQSSNRRLVASPNLVQHTRMVADSFFMHRYTYFFGTGWYNLGEKLQQINFSNNIGYNTYRTANYDRGEGWTTPPLHFWGAVSVSMPGIQFFPNAPQRDILLSYKASGRHILDRNVEVYINDTLSSKLLVSGFNLGEKKNESIPAHRIVGDRLNFRFRTDVEWWQDAANMNHLDLYYPRRFHFNSQRLFEFQIDPSPDSTHLRIAAFRHESRPPILYDFTNGRRFEGFVLRDTVRFVLPPNPQALHLMLGTNNTTLIQPIRQLQKIRFRDFSTAANNGSFTIITDREIFDESGGNAVDDYAAYRASAAGGSHKVVVVDIDEIYDQFGFGVRKHAVALRNYFRFIKPRHTSGETYFLLIGRGVFQWTYRLGAHAAGMQRLNSVPHWGMPVSDNLLSSRSNTHPVPELNVGRVPATTPEELRAYLNKLKDYEELVNKEVWPSQKAWMNRMMFLSGTSDSLPGGFGQSATLGLGFLFLDSLVKNGNHSLRTVGLSRSFSRNYADTIQQVYKWLREGAGFINYFGESHVTSIDIGLPRASQMKVAKGHYPILTAYGCYLGAFDYSWQRLSRYDYNYSEQQLFAPDAGAIAVITSSDVALPNYITLHNRFWLTQLTKDAYGQSVGQTFRKSLQAAYSSTSANDPYNYSLSQVAMLLGDPAIKPFPSTKPDLAIDPEDLSIMPLRSGRLQDSVLVQFRLYNLSRKYNQPVRVSFQRIFPSGKKEPLALRDFPVFQVDTLVRVLLPIRDFVVADSLKLEVQVDPANSIDEASKANNLVTMQVPLMRPTLTPIWPYPQAALGSIPDSLKAATNNAFAPVWNYRMEVDTTPLFNSNSLVRYDVSAAGGVVRMPANLIAWRNGQTYFWRTSPLLNGLPFHWQQSSFYYAPNTPAGFAQMNWWQLNQAAPQPGMKSDTTGRRFLFNDRPQSLFTHHSIYPHSGEQDSHFAIELNGITLGWSACVGSSIIFNVFDSATMLPMANTDAGLMGSGPVCAESRRYNFEYRYYPAPARQRILDFLKWVPKGSYVMARMILDPPYDSSYARFWARDSLQFGSGNTLYHFLKQQGFSNLDSMNYPRTFAFVFKKDDSISYKPYAMLSDGTADRIQHMFQPTIPALAGQLVSPDIGPARSWSRIEWQSAAFYPNQENNSRLTVWGRQPNGQWDSLKTFSAAETTIDLQSLSAQSYPMLRLVYRTQKRGKPLPDQLRWWRVVYEPATDLAASANDGMHWYADTLIEAMDTFSMRVPIINPSVYPAPASRYRIWFGTNEEDAMAVDSGLVKALGAGDTTWITYKHTEALGTGKYFVQLVLNKPQVPLETFDINNSGKRTVVVIPNQFRLISFTAVPNNNDALVRWQVSKEGPVKHYELLYGREGRWSTILITPRKTLNGDATYEFVHPALPVGYHFYQLRTVFKNGTSELSNIEKVWIGPDGRPISVYPNPFGAFFNVVPFNEDEPWEFVLFDALGRRVLWHRGAGQYRVSTAQLPAGNYFLQWQSGGLTEIIPLQKR